MEHLTEEQLNEYLDELLDESACQAVETHLAKCADCRGQMDGLELVFANLGELPDEQLQHDLTPAVLEKLPQKLQVHVWTRTLAAQVGVVAGTLVWLGMQLIPLIQFPQLEFPKQPTFDALSFLARLLIIQFTVPPLHFPDFNYHLAPIDFWVPTLSFQLSIAHLAVLVFSAFVLWVVGNLILLRRRQGASS
jgi:hypothetical protein